MWTPLVLPLLEGSKLALSTLNEKSVIPKVGSIVYCNIIPGYINHSGVYIGDGKIIHRTSSGLIKETSPVEFMNAGVKLALCIWVSCKDEQPVGSELVAKRAKDKLYSYSEYNLICNNCYQFCSGCLSGNFENNSSFFSLLESDCEEYLGSNNWVLWVWRDLDKTKEEIEKRLTTSTKYLGHELETALEDVTESLTESLEQIGEETKEGLVDMSISLQKELKKFGKNIKHFLD